MHCINDRLSDELIARDYQTILSIEITIDDRGGVSGVALNLV